jgi:hypothetical protein
MKSTWSLIAFVVLSVLVSSCRKDHYYPPAPEVRQYTFTDEFDDNYNNWNFSDPTYAAYAVIDESKGTMTLGYLDDISEAYYFSQNIGFNHNDDFVLQTRIGSDNNMGMLFGHNTSGAYGYSFTVDVDGYFAFYDEGGNGYGSDVVALVPRQRASFVNAGGDWNDLKLEQRGSRWIGYINDRQVFNIEAQRVRSGSIGYVLMANTIGETDYLQVDWLE